MLLEQKVKKLLLVFTIVFIAGCLPAARDKIVQTSTIDALLAGAYDGDMSCRGLLEHGNFGIGTFERLDGEMVVLGGKIYQIKSDGKVYRPAIDTKTPFATVCNFQPDTQFPIQSADYKTVQSIIDENVSNQNLFAAVEITGTFKYVRTRSVPAQNKPYPPLAEVTKTQPVFEMNDVKGTIVGFRAPAFVKGINVAGYHLHFLSGDYKRGGHILDFELTWGICRIDICNKFLLILPQGDLLKGIDLSQDKSAELHKVEQGK